MDLSFRALNRCVGQSAATRDAISVAYEPAVYLALTLCVYSEWLRSVTQTAGATSTLKVVLLVVKEKIEYGKLSAGSSSLCLETGTHLLCSSFCFGKIKWSCQGCCQQSREVNLPSGRGLDAFEYIIIFEHRQQVSVRPHHSLRHF